MKSVSTHRSLLYLGSPLFFFATWREILLIGSIVWHTIRHALDAILYQGAIEIDEQAEPAVGQAGIGENLLGVDR